MKNLCQFVNLSTQCVAELSRKIHTGYLNIYFLGSFQEINRIADLELKVVNNNESPQFECSFRELIERKFQGNIFQ